MNRIQWSPNYRSVYSGIEIEASSFESDNSTIMIEVGSPGDHNSGYIYPDFDIVIEDPIMGSNITNFQDNVSGAKNKSQGIELSTNWTDNDRLNIGFNYTFTKSYSGMDCDKPEKDKWGYTSCLDSGDGWLESAMVRVPIHALSSKINYQFDKDLDGSLMLNFVFL